MNGPAGANGGVEIDEADARGQRETGDQPRQRDCLPGHRVEHDLVHRREDPGKQVPDGHGLPGTDDRVGQHHHPPGGEADAARENALGIGDLGAGIGYRAHQPAVGLRNRQQQQRAAEKPEHGAARAAPAQPVIHDDEPADADHAAKPECEVLESAEGAAQASRR